MIISIKKYRPYIILLLLLVVIGITIDNSTSLVKVFFPIKYKAEVIKYSDINNLDPCLVFAVIKAESSFKPDAISYRNARGLMQISETTAYWGAESLKIENFKLEDLYDPEINIRIGCWYLANLMKQFNENIDLVIAAYNGGSGNVSEWLKNKEYSNTGVSLDKIPFKETDRFLTRVKSYYNIYKRFYMKKLHTSSST